jgi:glycosyltransferase involved in cell wall biosynthesis
MVNGALESNIFSKAKEIRKIPNLIQKNPFVEIENQAFNPEKSFNLVFISADINVKLKGFEILKEAFKILSLKNPSRRYNLIAIGSQNEKTEIVSTNSKIYYKKAFDQTLISSFYDQVSLLVVPSLTENSPNIIVEAQSAGLLVLATKVGGIPEMIIHGETGFLTEPNAISISNSLETIEKYDRAILNQITASAQSFVDMNNSAETIKSAFLDLYSKTIGVQ